MCWSVGHQVIGGIVNCTMAGVVGTWLVTAFITAGVVGACWADDRLAAGGGAGGT